MGTGIFLKATFSYVDRLWEALNGTKTRRATIGSLMSGFSVQGFLMISGILAARILGAEGRGNLAILTVFTVLVAHIGGLGIPQAATFYISRTKRTWELAKKLRPLIVSQTLFISAAHLFVVLIYIQEAPSDVKIAALYTLICTPGQLAREYGQAILQGQGRFRLFNIIRALPVAFYAILLVLLFVVERGNLQTVAAAWSISYLLTGLIVLLLAYSARQTTNSPSSGDSLPSYRDMTVFGLKGLFGWSSPLDSFKIDHLIAGLVLSSGALGFYVVGQAFTNIPKFISQSMGMIAYPTISGKQDTKEIKRIIWRFVFVSGALNILIVGTLWIIMPFLVSFFFGEDFANSVPLARILIIGALMLSFRRIIVECARGLGRPEISTYTEMVMYPWLLISLPFLIIPFGITGMAASVASGQLVSLILATYFMKSIWKNESVNL